MHCWHCTITGRVQGVGFRYFVKQLAEEHQATGWVCNCANGEVEAVICGQFEEDTLRELLLHGPGIPMKVIIAPSPLSEYAGFEIKASL